LRQQLHEQCQQGLPFLRPLGMEQLLALINRQHQNRRLGLRIVDEQRRQRLVDELGE
jgi:hypothetical protein